MLLPSALPCEIVAAVQRPQRPKLLAFSAYAPVQQDSYTGGLIASCRALHSILGGSTISASQLQSSTLSEAAQLSPFAPRSILRAASPVTPPRGQNKRKRDVFDDDEQEKENIPQSPRDRDLYQTPKRRRRAPLDLPLGLNATDFASLNTPVRTTPRRERDEDIEMPPLTARGEENKLKNRASEEMQQPTVQSQRRRSSPRLNDNTRPPDADCETISPIQQDQWSPLDDRRLVEVVLSKLSLSRRDWNDCAKQLGKDKDSLGRRWKMLIGEGNVGLRRGLGRHERGDLDITSW